MEALTATAVLSTHLLLPLSPTVGLVTLCAPHAQLDAALTQTLIALANQKLHIAVVVADNHFDAHTIARNINNEYLKVARAETPHQVRHLVRRLLELRPTYSVAVVIGLLEPFYDEGVKFQVAQTLLADTLALLNDLARTRRVLVITTPPPQDTRPYLKAQLTQAVEHYIELPSLASPKQIVVARLF